MTTAIKAQIQQESIPGIALKDLDQVTRKTVPLGPTGRILHKATLPKIGDVPIYLIHKTNAGVSQKEETKSMSQIKERDETTENKVN